MQIRPLVQGRTVEDAEGNPLHEGAHLDQGLDDRPSFAGERRHLGEGGRGALARREGPADRLEPESPRSMLGCDTSRQLLDQGLQLPQIAALRALERDPRNRGKGVLGSWHGAWWTGRYTRRVAVGVSLTPVPTAPYTFVAPIARGGMGFVELCVRREGRFWRWCARKRLHDAFRNDLRFRSMFMDEARLAGLVRHPNVIGVFDVGEDDQGPYLIMDYVEGLSLARAIRDTAKAGRPIPMQVAIRICREAALGLHAAHEARSESGAAIHLVHRDVSPQNILMGFDGTIRVTDFGIAKALGNVSQTNVGVLKGNLGYLSPEQLRFEEPDRRSDLFSLGVTLYELLSGAPLYPNTDGFDGTRRILLEPPPDIGEVRPDVPPAFVELLFEMLAKNREARPPTALEVARRLEGILAPLIEEEGSVGVADFMDQNFAAERHRHRRYLEEHLARLDSEASPVRTIEPLGPPRRRKWLWMAAGAAGALLLGLLSHGLAPAPHATSPAQTASAPSEPPRPSPQSAEVGQPAAKEPTESHTPSRLRKRSTERRLGRPAETRAGAAAVATHDGATGHPADLAVPLFTKWR